MNEQENSDSILMGWHVLNLHLKNLGENLTHELS
jgi:hypothetical protein